MNGDLMKQYIEFVADRLLVALDQPKVNNCPLNSDNVVMISFKIRSIMLTILLTLWKTFPWKERQTSLKRE